MTTTTSSSLTLSTLELPSPPLPIGSYVATVQNGNLLYTSGVLPMDNGQVAYTGAVEDTPQAIEKAQKAAKLCVLNALSLIQNQLGDLHRIRRVVKVTGFVSSKTDFYEQPQVMNAASDLLFSLFGEAGKHVRSAVGVASLPKNATVEVELIVEVA